AMRWSPRCSSASASWSRGCHGRTTAPCGSSDTRSASWNVPPRRKRPPRADPQTFSEAANLRATTTLGRNRTMTGTLVATQQFTAIMKDQNDPEMMKRNKIHTADGGSAYGFQGALIGGVTIYGWCIPAILEAF